MSKLNVQIIARGGNITADTDGDTATITVDSQPARDATAAANAAAEAANAATASLLATGGFAFDLVPSGSDQTAEFNTLANVPGRKKILFAPGAEIQVSSLANAIAVTITDPSDLTIDMNGGGIVQTWDGVDGANLGSLLGVYGGTGFTWKNGYITHSPRVTWQGVCTAIGTTFKVAIPPDQEPGWTTMDNVLWVGIDPDDGTLDIINWQYAAAGQKSVSYAIVPTDDHAANGDRIYEGSPLGVRYIPTAIISLNPLTLRFPTNTVVGGEVGAANLFSPLLGSVINNVEVQLSLDDEDDDTTVTVYTADGELIDASVAAGEPLYSGTGPQGGFDVPGVPYWMEVGQTLVGQFRKRHGRPYTFRGIDGPVTLENLNFRSAVAAGLVYDCGDLVLNDVIYKTTDGSYMSSTAGPFQCYNLRGTIRGRGVEFHGVGDDPINTRTQGWTKYITAYDVAAGWLDVPFNTYLPSLNQLSLIPRVGDIIRFVPPTTVGEVKRPILSLSVSPLDPASTRVSFGAGNIPAEFVPAVTRNQADGWAVWNRSTTPSVTLDKYHVYGGGARGSIFATWYLYIKDFYASGTWGTPTRGVIQSFSQGGFEGNHHFDNYTVKHSVYHNRPAANAALYLRVSQVSFPAFVTEPTGFPRSSVQNLTLIGYNYCGISITGVDLDVENFTLLDGGALRGPVEPTAQGAFDLWAEQGRLNMKGKGDPETTLKAFESTGGRIFINGERISGDVW